MEKIQQKMRSCLSKFVESQVKWDDINAKAMDAATKLVNNSIRNQFLEGDNWGVFSSDEILKDRVKVKLEEMNADLLKRVHELYLVDVFEYLFNTDI